MTITPPLTLLEEFLLLALDDQTGRLHPLEPGALNCAIAGAILMDLTLRNRIDNDLRDMFTVDSTPTRDDILDPVLETMAAAPVLLPNPITFWLRHIADTGEATLENVLLRLEKRGILRRQKLSLMWMFGAPGSPPIDEEAVREVKKRLLGAIVGGDIPAPRDIMLTGLAESCGLFQYIMSKTEAKDAAARIAQIARMDLIGQAVAKGIADVQPVLAVASGDR